ncbi:TPA: CcdB family protein [Escherichia coli]|uniref:CcdB family protein n=1 Tax=Escherichia coli TaxID=562 RepID=UPI002034B826|nr:CcdB family protein [Escherichia coli]
MKQFAVYKNKSRNKQAYPYFIDVQADMLAHLNTRLVMPLTQKANSNSQVKALTPVITIEQVDYVVLDTYKCLLCGHRLRFSSAQASVHAAELVAEKLHNINRKRWLLAQAAG